MRHSFRCLIRLMLFYVFFATCYIVVRFKPRLVDYLLKRSEFEDITDFTGADNITGFSRLIVPNIIHLVHFVSPDLNFGELLAIKSAFLNHNPDRIIIHCDCHQIQGELWNLVKDIPTLEIKYKKKPEYIFGKKITYIQHASDVARLEVLLEYGGIYIDGDVYVVKSLDRYRKYEFALNWDPGHLLASNVLVAHKNARFLKVYYELYHDYDPGKWYYNAGELPTKSILYHLPHWVHRVKTPDFAVGAGFIMNMLYREKTERWRNCTTIHTLHRHRNTLVKNDYVKSFDLENIKTYNKTFGDMARLVLFGSTDQIPLKGEP